MEFCDINVRVLYDFEYTTKYGRKINISSGERLLLIKKTNKDWWQVIRSSEQRPFYVPASYVKEVESKPIPAVRYQSKAKCILDSSENSALPSSSLQKDLLENNLKLTKSSSNLSIIQSEKSEVVKSNDDNNSTVPAHKSVSNTTMSSSGYNSLCEEVPMFEDEAQSVLIGSNSSLPVLVIRERQCEVLVESTITDTDKPLSDKSDNKPSTSHSQVLHIGSDHGKYSFVHNPRQFPIDMSLKLPPDLPVSESLEDLSLQIELKTSSLRNISESKEITINTKKIDDIPQTKGPTKSCSAGNFYDLTKTGSEPFFKEKTVMNLTQKKSKESRSSEDVYIKPKVPVDCSNLQYQGSFKTNIERQRWFNKSSKEQCLRNVQSCSEETTEDLKNPCKKEEVEQVKISEQNNMQEAVITISHFNESERQDKIDEVMQQSEPRERVLPKQLSSFLSDSQLSHLKAVKEKTTSRHSLDSVIEGELRENHNNFPRKYSSSVIQSVVAVHKASSEKSSTDSLLDLDDESKFRKISGGTTSDSLVPTDGEDLATSDSETDSVKLAKCKQEETKSARKIPLTRRRRVFASKTRPESLDPPSPIDQEPARSLGDGWHEFDTHDGRKYFYNLHTREKRWKPPRRTPNSNADEDPKAESDGEGQDTDDMFVVSLPLPSGYRSEVDSSSGQMCYINVQTGARALIQEVGQVIQEEHIVPLDKKILFSVWLLSHPETFLAAGDRFNLAKSTSHHIFTQVINAISGVMNNHITWPTPARQRETSRIFEARSRGFPGIIGAMDSTHIRIKQPIQNANDYYNRNKYHSVNLLAVCDDTCRFINIATGYPGRLHDARVYRLSDLGESLANDHQRLIPSENHHIIADCAYPLLPYVMTPYQDNGHLNDRQVNYNSKLSSVRSVIERSFGRLKGKFRKLNLLEQTDLNLITQTIVASCVIHNIIIDTDGLSDEEYSEDEDDANNRNVNIRDQAINREGNLKRNHITDILP